MANQFSSCLQWTGTFHRGPGGVSTFSRDLTVSFGGTTLPMSAAPDFHGDAMRANPEQLFVASLSACQALTYLFLAARHAMVVTSYRDEATGTLSIEDGRMRMTRVVLRPQIVVAGLATADKALELVGKAHRSCFIANSVSCRVEIEPTVRVAARAA
jgi:organic hydroperoxide reductase OsmC/OhrA